MGLTYEAIAAVNATLPKVDIKGKNYSIVAARIQGFRKLIPDGSIKTEIVSIDDSRVVMTATVADAEGRVLATGTAFEEKGSSYINKTSYVENCETSAVGRALAMLGIGSEENLCSADELVNAINNQGQRKADPKPAQVENKRDAAPGYPSIGEMRRVCEAYYKGDNLLNMLNHFGARKIADLNRESLMVAYNTAQRNKNEK